MANEQSITLHVAVGSKNPCKIEAVRTAFKDAFSSSSQANNMPVNVEIVISSYNVASDVPDQPMGDAETKLGAKNRADSAYKLAMKQYEGEGNKGEGDECSYGPPDFAVGLEGGVEEFDGVLWCMAWMAILGTDSDRCQLCKYNNDVSEVTTKEENIVNDEKGTSCNQDHILNESGTKYNKFWSYGRTGSFPLPPKVTQLVKTGMELGEADDLVFKRVNSKHGSGTVGILTKGMIDRSNYYDHALKLALVPWIRPELYLTESY